MGGDYTPEEWAAYCASQREWHSRTSIMSREAWIDFINANVKAGGGAVETSSIPPMFGRKVR